MIEDQAKAIMNREIRRKERVEARKARPPHISPQLRAVRNLLVRGLTNKEIGIRLGISPRTVEDHRSALFKEYRVRNAIELVRVVYGLDMEPAE